MLQKYEKKITYKYLWNKIKNADDNRYKKTEKFKKKHALVWGTACFPSIVNKYVDKSTTNKFSIF